MSYVITFDIWQSLYYELLWRFPYLTKGEMGGKKNEGLRNDAWNAMYTTVPFQQ